MKRKLVVELFDCLTGSTDKQQLHDTLGETSILVEWQWCLCLFSSMFALLLEHLTLEISVSFIDQTLGDCRFKEILQ